MTDKKEEKDMSQEVTVPQDQQLLPKWKGFLLKASYSIWYFGKRQLKLTCVILLWFARNMERFWDSWMDWGSAIFRRNWAALCKKKKTTTIFPFSGTACRQIHPRSTETHLSLHLPGSQQNSKTSANLKLSVQPVQWQRHLLLLQGCWP